MRKYLNNILISGFLIISPLTGSFTMVPSNTFVIEPEPEIKEVKADVRTDKEINADLIKDIALSEGIRPDDMLAMWHLESLTGDALVGDNGCSRGNFHINLCANPSAKDVVGDLKTEAEWVADRLHKFDYSKDRVMAIAKYNLPAGGSMKYYRNVEERKQYIKKYLD